MRGSPITAFGWHLGSVAVQNGLPGVTEQLTEIVRLKTHGEEKSGT